MILLKLPGRHLLRDLLSGEAMRPSPLGEKGPDAVDRLARTLRRLLFGAAPGRTMPRDPDGGPYPPDAGRPAPLHPSPGHHLVAAKALPPSDRTHLLPKD